MFFYNAHGITWYHMCVHSFFRIIICHHSIASKVWRSWIQSLCFSNNQHQWNGIKDHRTYDGTLLYKNGVAVPAVSLEKCLASIFDWLKNSGMKHPVLFAHNARKFDSLIFGRSVLDSGKEEREKVICGFCDTLPMLKKHASGSHVNFSLDTLAKDILGCTFSPPDVVEDYRYLQKFVEHHNIDSFYLQYSFSMRYIIDSIKQMETSKNNLHTLMLLLENHIISEKKDV